MMKSEWLFREFDANCWGDIASWLNSCASKGFKPEFVTACCWVDGDDSRRFIQFTLCRIVEEDIE